MTQMELLAFFRELAPEELAKRRQAAGLTQPELALSLGVSVQTISRWESGQVRIPKTVDGCLRLLEEAIAKAPKEKPASNQIAPEQETPVVMAGRFDLLRQMEEDVAREVTASALAADADNDWAGSSEPETPEPEERFENGEYKW